MKQILLSLLFPVLMALLGACSDNLPFPNETKPEAERTVILYMMAENSLARYAADDLAEIARAHKDVPPNTNLIIYVDDHKLPRIYEVTAKNSFTVRKTFPQDRLSTDSAVMLNTLLDIKQSFPARKYGLVMWSHGSGWIPQTRSIGVDNGQNSFSNTGLEMNITTLRGVLEKMPKLEFILFDACLMQSIETAYELRHTTCYTLGSPTEIHANGAPYDRILKPMMMGNLQEVARQYYESYKDDGGVVISLLDCGKLELLAQATANILPQFQDSIQTKGTDGIQIYSPYSMYNSWAPEPFDMESAMHKALSEEDFEEWKKALEQVVCCHYTTESWTSVYPGYQHSHLTDHEHHTAVSMFIPDTKYTYNSWNEKFQRLQWCEDVGWKIPSSSSF